MASQTLDTSDNHNERVRDAEDYARAIDCTRGDFATFQAALTSLEKYLRDLWTTLDTHPSFSESFGALFAEQKELSEGTRYLLDGLVSRYDRYLTLV